jgi:hypothetical protein
MQVYFYQKFHKVKEKDKIPGRITIWTKDVINLVSVY